MKRRQMARKIAISSGIFVIVVFSFAKYKNISPISLGLHNKINQAVFSDKAIEGYDCVAYFKKQKPVQGDNRFSCKWNDATWTFSSEENMNQFEAAPEKYAPQFGGYCSFAVSTGFTAKIDPTAFAIIDNKLYLSNDQTVKEKWMANPTANLEKDIKNWK